MAILSCSISKPAPRASQKKRTEKAHRHLPVLKIIIFIFFPQMFELMKVLLFYPHEFSTNKISWQIKSYANTGQFFLCFNSKNTVGQEENRIFLTYYPQLKDRSIFGMDQAWSNFNNNTRPSTITQVHKFLFCFFNKTTT